MKALFADLATSTTVGVYNAAATTFTVQAGDGAMFPQPDANSYFMAVLEDRTQTPIAREIVQVTGRLGDVMTVSRAQEGTAALAWGSGVIFANRVTAGSLTSLREDAIAGQRYYGSLGTAPTISPAGTLPQNGDAYWNPNFQTIYVYNGAAWEDSQANSPGDRTVTGNQSIGGNSLVVGASTVEGAAVFQETVSIVGAATIVGDLLVMDSPSGTSTVLGTSTIQGNLVLGGAATIDGTALVGGSLGAGGDLGVGGSGSVNGDLEVGGTLDAAAIEINGRQVVAANVSGNFLSQIMPTNNVFQWGRSATDGTAGSGSVRVTYPFPMPNATQSVIVQPIGAGFGLGTMQFLVFTIDALGFTVSSYDPLGGKAVTGAGFAWFAVGN